VWLIAEPALYRTDPERSLFGDIAAGRWGRIARLMAAGLFAGALWESFNSVARGKWIYTVPFLEHIKIFEMPPVGFLGFPSSRSRCGRCITCSRREPAGEPCCRPSCSRRWCSRGSTTGP